MRSAALAAARQAFAWYFKLCLIPHKFRSTSGRICGYHDASMSDLPETNVTKEHQETDRFIGNPLSWFFSRHKASSVHTRASLSNFNVNHRRRVQHRTKHRRKLRISIAGEAQTRIRTRVRIRESILKSPSPCPIPKTQTALKRRAVTVRYGPL
jgi:hypothetical protein